MSMESVMDSSLESLPKTIDSNFEELRTQLAESLELYAGLVVIEDGIEAAKKDRARLNRLREALEAKRKKVKRECMAPYIDFEVKVKEPAGFIDQPTAAIDGQLKAYEEQRRAVRHADILAIYEETVGELRALLPFEKLWQDGWYNTGVSMKKIREAIVAAEAKAAADLEVLPTVESEFAEAVRPKYLENLDLYAALAECARLQEQAAQLRKYEGQLRSKGVDTMPEPRREPVDGPIPQSDAFRETPPQETETIYRLALECQVTMPQAKELSAWLNIRNILFRRVRL